jgi:hypothetical protein
MARAVLDDGGWSKAMSDKNSGKRTKKVRGSQRSLEEIQRWNRQDIDRWQERNTTFQNHQDMYQLNKPPDLTPRIAADLLILNDPRVMLKKVARIIARHAAMIEVEANPGTDGVAAQIIENWFYMLEQALNERWMLGLHNPFRFDQAFLLLLRGWIAERTMIMTDRKDEYDDDQFAIWDHCAVDPANVYPFSNGYEITRVTHAWTTNVSELQDDPFYDLEDTCLYDVDGRSVAFVRATYWKDNGSWWHACTVGQAAGSTGDCDWIKAPTEIGYNPWTILTANGSSYRQTPWDDLEYVRSVGSGLLDDNYDTYKAMNRLATKFNELVAQESNPPVVIKNVGGKILKVDVGPGGRTYLSDKESLDLLRVGPNLSDLQLLWNILEKRSFRGSLPPQFFAESDQEGGFSAATLMAAGKDVLFPYVEAINWADRLKFKKILQLYKDYGPSKPLHSHMAASQMPPGYRPQVIEGKIVSARSTPMQGQPGEIRFGSVLQADITVHDIEEQGFYGINVSREEMTPQEQATHINLGLAQLREKAISLDTFRKDYAKLRNPAGENLKVLADMVYLNEDVVKALTPMALSASHQEFLRNVWERIQNPVPPTPQLGNPAGAPSGMPAPAPGPGGAPGMPPGQPGLPQLPPGLIPGAPGMGGPPAMPPGLPLGTGTGLPPVLAGLPPGMPMMGGSPTQLSLQNPQMAAMQQLMALLNGGAQGGAGGGGLPPIPGAGSPVPPMPMGM